MKLSLLTIQIRQEQDVVLTRQRARQIAAGFGFSSPQQTSVATAVSELARNAVVYGGGGSVEFFVRDVRRDTMLHITLCDHGKGIADLNLVLGGQYQSQTGMGLGIIGSQRLSDSFEIESSPEKGTCIEIGFRMPRGLTVTPERIAAVTNQLSQQPLRTPFNELQYQNGELMAAIQALHQRQADVERLNAELAETNRGVLALYAELDEQAASLRAASEYKNRFLSDMTHELRTPLNAMISLSRLLLDRADGELTEEQQKQVGFIHKSANNLGEMVNDLLDIARIESGRTEIDPAEFELADLFAALRGMFRPLFASSQASLFIEDAADIGPIFSDEQKIAQILRNLISNALKFTEQGEVRVAAERRPGDRVLFTVVDSGIGIAEQDLESIFNDFTQIQGARQRKLRGTGLGLPLTRKLCRLLGGDVGVTSRLGVGTTFSVLLPRRVPKELIAAGGVEGRPQ